MAKAAPRRPRYTATFAPSAAREFRKIKNQDDRRRIAKAVDDLEEDPRRHGVEKLTADADIYRYRVGDWRILFSIEDRELVIEVVTVGNRRDVYKR